MAQNASTSQTSGPSAPDREVDHVDKLMNGDQSGEAPKQAKKGESGLNHAIQVNQDNRIAKAQADAKAAGGGPDKPEDWLNQDG